uniref:Uncharacterized protein n=1 Tax=Vitis vinifera TaxID=29760 RepID=A5C7F0_VITVI|nr:hypothetical protein VITISV_011563 [Vitis vinifera]
MMLDLPQDGSVLDLSGKNLLLLRTKGCDLLSENALRSGQCLTEYEQCHFVKGESRLENSLDMLAHKGYGVPLLYVELLKYHVVHLCGGDFLASHGDFLAGGGHGVGSDSGSKDDSVRSIGSETFAFFFGGLVPDFWPLEELAPAMASSEVESWISAPLGILRRVDGDEDFAPRVLAMAMSTETAGDARGLLRRISRGVFRNEEAWISQRLGVFAVRGISASISQPISQLRNERTTLQTGTRVPKGGFTAAKHPSKWCLVCETVDLQARKKSQPIRSCETVVLGCEMALVCQGGFSQLRNGFAAEIDFLSEKRDFRSGF